MSLLFQWLLFAGLSPDPAALQDGAPAVAGADASPRPSVYLAVEGELTEWLVVRLLADGYPLVSPADAAQIELSVVPQGDHWSVRATGVSTVVFEVETASDVAVTRLELLHRSLDALEDVEAKPGPEARPATVALTVTENSPPEFATEVAGDILAAGVMLVPAGGSAEIQVCADKVEDTSRILVVDGAADCATAEEPGAALFEAVHFASTTQRVEAAVAELRAPEAALEPEPEPEPEPAVFEPAVDLERPPGLNARESRVVTPDGRRRPVVRGGVGAGAFGRITNVDPVFLGALSFGREPGIQGWMEVHVRPATVTGPLTILEVYPAAGILTRPLAVGRVAIIAGGLVGPEFHRYRLRAGEDSNDGVDTALSGEFLLGVAIAFWKENEVHLAFRAGGSPQRTHLFRGEEIWTRHPLRVGATISVMFGRRLGA